MDLNIFLKAITVIILIDAQIVPPSTSGSLFKLTHVLDMILAVFDSFSAF